MHTRTWALLSRCSRGATLPQQTLVQWGHIEDGVTTRGLASLSLSCRNSLRWALVLALQCFLHVKPCVWTCVQTLPGAATAGSWSHSMRRPPRSWRKKSRRSVWPRWTPSRRRSWRKSLELEASPPSSCLWTEIARTQLTSTVNTYTRTHTHTHTRTHTHTFLSSSDVKTSCQHVRSEALLLNFNIAALQPLWLKPRPQNEEKN